MKFTVSKEPFLKALQLTSKAISAHPIVPLFSNVHLEVTGDNARLSATNFEVGISTSIPITENGSSFNTAIPGKLLTDFIGALSADEEVSMLYNVNKQVVSITTETSKNNIKCMNADDFPAIPTVENAIKVPSTYFKEAVGRVSFAAATDTDKNPVLCGVLITINNGKLVLCAVDGFHLSYEEIPMDEHNVQMKSIVKASTLDLITRLIDDDTTLYISNTDSQVRFKFNETNIVCQTIGGEFPDYKMLKPVEPKTSISLSTVGLLNACKQLELFTPDNGLMKFHFKGVLVSLSTETNEKGDSNVNVFISGLSTGTEITTGINIFFLHEFLEACNTEEITIDFVDERSPILLHMKDFETYYHIIMPIAV